jgi:hypothetical protein
LSEKSNLGPIGIIQLHDAVLKEFQVLAGGRVSIRFENVSVYRSSGECRYDVWIHDATLMMQGVTKLSVDGAWIENDDDYVLDDDIYGVGAGKVRWLGVADAEIRRIRFVLFSGARIEIACKQASLSLSEEGELVGEWEER